MKIIKIETCKECLIRINHGCGARDFEWIECPDTGIHKDCPLEELNKADVMPSVCLHLTTYVDEDNFQRCQSCDEIVD